MASNCSILIGDMYFEGPLKISSTKMRAAASVGWNASQKIWSFLLEQMLEIGRHGIWAFNSPSPQHAAFTLANPEKRVVNSFKILFLLISILATF